MLKYCALIISRISVHLDNTSNYVCFISTQI